MDRYGNLRRRVLDELWDLSWDIFREMRRETDKTRKRELQVTYWKIQDLIDLLERETRRSLEMERW